ncbi:hypothetical protein AB0L63_03745 [Nocardia sp. NPDC051990]|uniref:hypothetical protein n=1 Tax=Nocardia sp. NPDC051990 TaxID=3155285 RepID=UPI00342666C8
MSMPSIPGFTTPPVRNTLADLWTKPGGEFPAELWPIDALRTLTTQPSEWLTIEQLTASEDLRDGRSCVLVVPDQAVRTLNGTGWVGDELGSFWVQHDGRFELGLAMIEAEAELEFFVQVRQPLGAATPTVDVALSFLWYWDAYPISGGWEYLDQAGRKHDLIRYQCAKDTWKVEIRVLEFRQYLAAVGKSAIMQVDVVRYSNQSGFERVDDTFRKEWAHLQFVGVEDGLVRPSMSRVVGQYILIGQRGPRIPRFEEFDRDDVKFPEFIYGINPDTNVPLKHTCDPDELGTYFDDDDSRLHYLTPVCFKREVLEPYAAQPTTFRITATHLSCLNLWGIDIGFNSVGLVQVYLGDLGGKLPPEEWGRWLAHNVLPEGTMDEGRFRRDFLGQWANSKDLPGDLRRAREHGSEVSERLLGEPLWRTLPENHLPEWESMIGPLNEDPASLGKSLMLLPIAIIDAINPAPLKKYLGGAEKGERSLSLLQRFTAELGDEDNCTAILRQLYEFRSKGGVAHFAGSEARQTRVALGIEDMSNLEAFESVIQRVADMLNTIVDLMEKKLPVEED